MGRKIIDERDARACLKAADAAGISRREWAWAHDVDARSLNAWRINLGHGTVRKPRAGQPGLRLVELVPTSVPRAEGRYVVRVAGAEIALDDDFRDETLVRIVRALRAC